jgi:hypothetical protein
MSAFTHPTRTYPSAWTEYSAKVVFFSDICKFGKQNLLFYAKIAPIRRIGQIRRIGKLEDGQWAMGKPHPSPPLKGREEGDGLQDTEQ